MKNKPTLDNSQLNLDSKVLENEQMDYTIYKKSINANPKRKGDVL